MIFDWLRSRAALLGELREVRELAAEYATDLVQARVDLRAARTPSAELLAEKARADALEARLDVLQRANEALDWR